MTRQLKLTKHVSTTKQLVDPFKTSLNEYTEIVTNRIATIPFNDMFNQIAEIVGESNNYTGGVFMNLDEDQIIDIDVCLEELMDRFEKYDEQDIKRFIDWLELYKDWDYMEEHYEKQVLEK